jgi:hypothetical protein
MTDFRTTRFRILVEQLFGQILLTARSNSGLLENQRVKTQKKMEPLPIALVKLLS